MCFACSRNLKNIIRLPVDFIKMSPIIPSKEGSVYMKGNRVAPLVLKGVGQVEEKKPEAEQSRVTFVRDQFGWVHRVPKNELISFVTMLQNSR